MHLDLLNQRDLSSAVRESRKLPRLRSVCSEVLMALGLNTHFIRGMTKAFLCWGSAWLFCYLHSQSAAGISKMKVALTFPGHLVGEFPLCPSFSSRVHHVRVSNRPFRYRV